MTWPVNQGRIVQNQQFVKIIESKYYKYMYTVIFFGEM